MECYSEMLYLYAICRWGRSYESNNVPATPVAIRFPNAFQTVGIAEARGETEVRGRGCSDMFVWLG